MINKLGQPLTPTLLKKASQGPSKTILESKPQFIMEIENFLKSISIKNSNPRNIEIIDKYIAECSEKMKKYHPDTQQYRDIQCLKYRLQFAKNDIPCKNQNPSKYVLSNNDYFQHKSFKP